MRIVCVWREASDYRRTLDEWLTEFTRRTGEEVESLDPDTGDGESFCRAHDIVEYPTMVVLADDGRELGRWQGKDLPTFDEVTYWLQ